MRTLWLKLWRDLRAMWPQTVALVLIMGLGIASYVGLVAAYRDLGTSYDNTYAQLNFADVTLEVAGAPESVATELAGLDGVKALSARLVVDTGLELASGDQIRARLVGLPASGQPPVNSLLIEQGRMLQNGDQEVAVVESDFAGIYDLHPGDTVAPIVAGHSTPLQVVGVATSPEYLVVSPSRQDILPSARTFAVIFMPLESLQAKLGLAGTANNFALLLDEGTNQESVVAAAQELLRPYQLQATTWQANQPSSSALRQDLEGFREIANLMPTLIILVAAISVYVMLGRMVRAQQPQIGLMKALGYGNRAVLAYYLAVALAIALLGLLLGVALGVPLGGWITQSYATTLGIPLVQTRLYPGLILVAGALGLAAALLAGIGPSRQSAQLAPATAMRLDPATALADGRRSLLERLVPLPLWLRLPARNVFRLRRRGATTALGVIFSFMLILMVLGMSDAMGFYLNRTFDVISRWDMLVIFDTPQTQATVTAASAIQGVGQVEPVLQLPATVKVNGTAHDVLLIAFDPKQQMHILQLPGSTTPEQALAEDRLVLTEAMADRLKLQAGDEFSLDTPFGTHRFTLGSTTDEMLNSVAYTSLDTMQKLSPLPLTIFNGLYLAVDPALTGQIKADLYHLPGAASVQIKQDVRDGYEEFLALFYAFMAVMLAFALAMAFALIFNVVTINVLERQRELATMRAVGAGRWRILALISVENGVMWLLSLLPGSLLGAWVATQMGKAFSAELFSFKVSVAPASYVLTAVGILLTMLLASLPAVRRVNRLDLAQATKILT